MPIYGKTPNQSKILSGNSPLTFYSNGDNLTSYTIGGNSRQTGVPSPQNIIMPEFCGVRTENLFDAAAAYDNLYNNGVVSGTTRKICSIENNFDESQVGKQITISITANKVTSTSVFILSDIAGVRYTSNAIYQDNTSVMVLTVTPQSTSDKWFMSYGSYANNECVLSNIMLNSGSTALPYEPFGYKIPITCGGQTTPVYLGQVQTVRKIKKLVLNGTETVVKAASNPVFTLSIGGSNAPLSENVVTTLSTHYQAQSNVSGTGNVSDMSVCIRRGYSTMYIGDTRYDNETDFKSYLAAQYAAGTPVTIWYVLATPTTGIVNEPLAKIGDYTDTLVYYTGAPEIPTEEGKTILSVDTELRPSQITIQYTSGNEPIKQIYGRTAGLTHTKSQVPPISFNANDQGLTSWSMLGNGVQSGTPTPQSIIMPTFCGVRTENLCNVSDENTLTYASSYNNFLIDDTQNITTSGNALFGFLVPVTQNTAYTVYANSTKYGAIRVREYSEKPSEWAGTEFIQQTVNAQCGYAYNFTTTAQTKWIAVAFYFADTQAGAVISNIMLNTGSTALPYEPFGWAEKITCAGQTTPVYLGQTQTVRRVRKLVLTGQETWEVSPVTGGRYFRYMISRTITAVSNIGICTHYKHGNIISPTINADNFTINAPAAGGNGVVISPSDVSLDTAIAFKSYLAAQYAAGTPVTVWYVLTEPQTAIVNEPLCKIGDYADELHSEDAAVTIPTAKGANTISVDTTLQPSNLSITYTSPDYSEIKLVYDNQGNILYNDPPYHDWGAVRWIVRQGLAPQYYPIGYIFYDNFNPETGTAFQVVAHDNHFDPALTAAGYTHSMTLCEVLLDDVITMDAIEAFLYTNQSLPAGTYKFTIPNYDASYGGNKTYYFTSTSELPANSQIVMNWPYNQTPKTVTGYAPTASLTAMENATAATGWNALTLTEWVDGTSPAATDLGTIAGPTNQAGTSSYGSMNHIHRARYGSNNYLQSGARQFLNSDKAAGQWWTPQTVFDRPYGSRNSAGKLTKLRSDFVSVLATPTIQSRTNSYFETTSLDGTTFSLSTNYNITTDRLFLLSPMEVGFSTTDTTVGTLLDYYINATNDTRIKKRKSNNTAYYWWLRTPDPSTCVHFRIVSTTGSLSGSHANSLLGLPAAACIQ